MILSDGELETGVFGFVLLASHGKDMLKMSMTRDSYAREVLKAAEAAFLNNESPRCPRENCTQNLSVVQQNTQSTRSLFCPVHGHIFQEQALESLQKLDWESAAERVAEHNWDEDEPEEPDDEE